MKKLTERQKAILDYIKRYFKRHNYWPSIREIQECFKFKSTNSVMGHLKALENKGYISRPGKARVYNIGPNLKENNSLSTVNTIALPIYGSIVAGYPDYVESDSTIGTLNVDASQLNISNPFKSFALKVRGDSMIDAGIFEGDYVVAEKGEPKDKDIVIALIDGESTLKRYVKNPTTGTSFLKAENKAYKDLLPTTELFIQGVAKAVVRCL